MYVYIVIQINMYGYINVCVSVVIYTCEIHTYVSKYAYINISMMYICTIHT